MNQIPCVPIFNSSESSVQPMSAPVAVLSPIASALSRQQQQLQKQIQQHQLRAERERGRSRGRGFVGLEEDDANSNVNVNPNLNVNVNAGGDVTSSGLHGPSPTSISRGGDIHVGDEGGLQSSRTCCRRHRSHRGRFMQGAETCGDVNGCQCAGDEPRSLDWRTKKSSAPRRAIDKASTTTSGARRRFAPNTLAGVGGGGGSGIGGGGGLSSGGRIRRTLKRNRAFIWSKKELEHLHALSLRPRETEDSCSQLQSLAAEEPSAPGLARSQQHPAFIDDEDRQSGVDVHSDCVEDNSDTGAAAFPVPPSSFAVQSPLPTSAVCTPVSYSLSSSPPFIHGVASPLAPLPPSAVTLPAACDQPCVSPKPVCHGPIATTTSAVASSPEKQTSRIFSPSPHSVSTSFPSLPQKQVQPFLSPPLSCTSSPTSTPSLSLSASSSPSLSPSSPVKPQPPHTPVAAMSLVTTSLVGLSI